MEWYVTKTTKLTSSDSLYYNINGRSNWLGYHWLLQPHFSSQFNQKENSLRASFTLARAVEPIELYSIVVSVERWTIDHEVVDTLIEVVK